MKSSWPAPLSARSTTVYAALAILAMLINGLTVISAPASWNFFSLQGGSPDWVMRDCAYTAANADSLELPSAECNFAQGGGKAVYLIGDSNAAHHSDGVMLAAKKLGRPFFGAYSGSCPTLPVVMISEGGVHEMEERDADARCLPWFEFIFTELRSAPAGTVVFSISPSYWNSRYVGVRTTLGSDATNQKVVLESALVAQVEVLFRLGHEVVLVSPFIWPQFECRETLAAKVLGDDCHASINATPQWNIDAVESMRSVAITSGAKFVDLTEVQCPNGYCSNSSQGINPYSLGYSHLSAEFGALTEPHFSRHLRVKGGVSSNGNYHSTERIDP